MTKRKLAVFAALAASLSATPAGAQDVYKIGISAGLTGYAATVDRGWRDGVEIAAAALNAKGGIMGRKIEVVTEDNKSEPQEAVTVYRKMISSDKADIFLSGCVSAGNFAGAPLTVRAQIPMVLCSILPQQPDHVKWAFSTLPPAGFEVSTRLQYLKEKTSDQEDRRAARSVARMPFCRRTSPRRPRLTMASRSPASSSTSRTTPTSVCRSARCTPPGARAVLKIGLGGTTLTAART
jgi:hypothetical protein